jgi:alpha-ribazole phosphatase
MRLWLVRHARTGLGPDICCGRTDAPADPEATAQAAQRLHAALPPAFVWWVSPQIRARQLAHALHALRPALPSPVTDACLAEFDFGTWEGRRWDDVPRAELDAWAADFAHARPGGGESVAALLARVRSALHRAMATRASDGVWITHAGVIRAVHYTLRVGGQGLPHDGQDWPAHAPDCGEWDRVELPDWRPNR